MMSDSSPKGSTFEVNMVAEPSEWNSARTTSAMGQPPDGGTGPAAAAAARSPHDPHGGQKERRLDHDPHLPAKVQGLIERQDITADVVKRLQDRVLLLEDNAVAAEKRFAKFEGLDTQNLLGQARRDIKINSDELKKMTADMTEFAKPLTLQTYIAPLVDRALEEKWKLASAKFDADLDTLHKHTNELIKRFEDNVETIKKLSDTVMDKVTVLNGDFD